MESLDMERVFVLCLVLSEGVLIVLILMEVRDFHLIAF